MEMGVLRELITVGSITDYSEPKQERALRNRAVLFSTVMLLAWAISMYEAHLRHFPEAIKVVILSLGLMLMTTVVYSALVKACVDKGVALRNQLWAAWRVQQGASGIVYICIFVIFLGWHIVHRYW
jgi:hypothetical protein